MGNSMLGKSSRSVQPDHSLEKTESRFFPQSAMLAQDPYFFNFAPKLVLTSVTEKFLACAEFHIQQDGLCKVNGVKTRTLGSSKLNVHG